MVMDPSTGLWKQQASSPPTRSVPTTSYTQPTTTTSSTTTSGYRGNSYGSGHPSPPPLLPPSCYPPPFYIPTYYLPPKSPLLLSPPWTLLDDDSGPTTGSASGYTGMGYAGLKPTVTSTSSAGGGTGGGGYGRPIGSSYAPATTGYHQPGMFTPFFHLSRHFFTSTSSFSITYIHSLTFPFVLFYMLTHIVTHTYNPSPPSYLTPHQPLTRK